ncbi:glycosyltransferase family 31 protein [Aspergillus thermomutatus]|uniref:N-acetylgalactosaminide beta-1,3-galactosyltransferase n=1 Tax=Aspergillus thermomutatus TaxID=41047 RepID=A0A397GSX6_ASPTH|nr:uncharacterized protein CDV56_107360 [Aspergillus thermomutatus]RHZ52634.1 hypothetical protein CDV56_107360 [Aspergillus thermomutatus]
MYLNNVTRVQTAALRLLCSFGGGISGYWKSRPKKRRNRALVFILTGCIFCLGLKLGFGLFHTDYWEWETTSRFSNSPHANELRGNSDGDNLCDSFPLYLLPRVQVVLKIGSTEPPSRVDTHLTTVTRCITNLIVFSDHESEIKGHRVHDILATLPDSFWGNTSDFQAYSALQRGESETVGASQGWKLDRFKFLPMVERAYEMNPTAKWFVFLESDTYFVWDNLFRLLDQFDPSLPLYFGSPTAGKGRSFFAYGGAGFVLSTAAVQKLVARRVGRGSVYSQPPLNQQYEGLVKEDCCGDSVLGWALYQSGVKLSGMWPMFNPHPLHGIPFDERHWCQPVISMHKLSLEDMTELVRWEKQRRRGRKLPLLYADLFEYTKLGTVEYKTDWDNGDWGGWQEPSHSPAHSSLEACTKACHEHPECFSYTYDHSGHCIFVPSIRLGAHKPATEDTSRLSAGWDLEKIKQWRDAHKCRRPQWVKPSTDRIF